MTNSSIPVYVSEQVRAVEQLHQNLFTEKFRQYSIRDQLDLQSQRILQGHQAGNRAVVPHITCWHLRLNCQTADVILGSDFSLEDARATIAREYGFANWADVEVRGVLPPDPVFELTVDVLLSGDVARLRDLLAAHPELIRQRSAYGHQATLLHYVGSNGVETYRQRVPRNLSEITQFLIDAGADVNATANMYGVGSTTLGLLLTSDHPAKAGVVQQVKEVLLAAGAKSQI